MNIMKMKLSWQNFLLVSLVIIILCCLVSYLENNNLREGHKSLQDESSEEISKIASDRAKESATKTAITTQVKKIKDQKNVLLEAEAAAKKAKEEAKTATATAVKAATAVTTAEETLSQMNVKLDKLNKVLKKEEKDVLDDKKKIKDLAMKTESALTKKDEDMDKTNQKIYDDDWDGKSTKKEEAILKAEKAAIAKDKELQSNLTAALTNKNTKHSEGFTNIIEGYDGKALQCSKW